MSGKNESGLGALLVVLLLVFWLVSWLFGSPGEGHNWNSKQIQSYRHLRDAGFSDAAARKAVR
jgi:uncharacterized protein HemY